MTNCTCGKSELTPREGDVLAMLKKGDTNKEIADALGLQVVTIKLHVRGIMRKFNAKNRTHAVVMALANDNKKAQEAA